MNLEFINQNEIIVCNGKEYKAPKRLFNIEKFNLINHSHNGNRLLFSKIENNQTAFVSIAYDLKYPIIKYYKTYNTFGFITDKIDVSIIDDNTFICQKSYEVNNQLDKYDIKLSKEDFYSLIGFGIIYCQKESIKNKYYITKLPSSFLIKITKEFSKNSIDTIDLISFIIKGIQLIDEDDINSRYEKYYLFFKMIDIFLMKFNHDKEES